MISSNKIARCDAQFKREIVAACCKAFVDEGFTAYRKDRVDRPFGNGFHGWVGLNTGLYPDRVEINPFVGVHSVAIEKLSNSLDTDVSSRYDRGVPTFAVHFGSIAPNIRGFRFDRSTNVGSEATRLASMYKEIGLDYSKSLASFAVLLPLMKERVSLLGGYPQRYVACLYLMGRKNEVLEFVSEAAAESSGHLTKFYTAFHDFVVRGRARVAT